jgi:hypothetical protein
MSDDVLAGLRAGGVLEREGSFEVDAAKAREKMSQFQLEDPHLYVLEFVQAAHLLGASAISIVQDADELDIRFDGQTLEAGHLSELWTMALSRQREPRLRALRHLAIGINASAGLKPARLLIESGAGDAVQRLTVQPGRAEVVEQTRWPEGASGTRIYVREAWRPGHMVEFWRNQVGMLEESRHVRDRCLRSDIHIEVGGHRVSMGKLIPSEVVYQTRFALGDDYGRVWLTTSVDDQRAHVLQHGVEVMGRKLPLEGLPVGWAAIIEAPRLSKDLSQADFVRDDAWQLVMVHALFETICALIMRAINDGALPGDDQDEASRELILRMIDLHVPIQEEHTLILTGERLGSKVVESARPLGHHYDVLWSHLCKQAVWSCDVDGRRTMRTLAQIKGKMDPARLEWADPLHEVRPARQLVVRADAARVAQLARALKAPAEDVGAAYIAAAEREVHVKRWQAQPAQEGIPEGMCFPSQAVQVAGGCAHVAVRCGGRKPLTVIERCQGRLIGVRELGDEGALAGVVIMIDSAGELDEAGTGLAWGEPLALLWAEALLSIAPAVGLAVSAVLDQVSADAASRALVLALARRLVEGKISIHPGMIWQGVKLREHSEEIKALLYKRAALYNALALVPAADSPARFRELIAALGVFARVPVFGGVGADAAPRSSLEDVAGALEANGRLAVLGSDELGAAAPLMSQPSQHGAARLVVCARDDMQRYTLQRLVPGGLQLRWLAALERDAAQQRFMARPTLPLALPARPSWLGADAAPGSVGWLASVQLAYPQIEGALGMGAPGDQGGIICHVLYEEREIATWREPVAWGRFEAVVRVRDAEPTAAFDGLEMPPAYDKAALFRELEVAAHALIGSWLAQLKSSGANKDAALKDEAAVEALWRLSIAAYEDSALRQAREVREGLDALPCFELLSGKLISHAILHKRLDHAAGPVHYVVGAVGVMESLAGDATLVLRLPSSRFVPLLPRAIGPRWPVLRDVSDSDARRDALRQRRDAFMARQQTPMLIGGALHRCNAERGGVKLSVGLMPDPHMRDKIGVASIDLLYEQRLVTTLREPLPLGVFEVRLFSPDLKLDAEWSALAPDYPLSPLRAAARAQCWETLIEACDKVDRAPAPLRRQLGWYLVRAVSADDPLARERGVYDALVAMRLFQRVGAQPASYDLLRTVARPVRYVQASRIGDEGAQGAVIVGSWDEQELLRALFPDAEEVAPPAAPRPDKLVADAKHIKADTPAKSNTSVEPDPPGAQLTARVHAQLLAARGESRVLLGDVWLSRLTHGGRGAAQPLCAVTAEAVEINLDHPACQLAAQHLNAATLAPVTAAVYAAINRREEIITDAHERTYLAQLAKLVAAS